MFLGRDSFFMIAWYNRHSFRLRICEAWIKFFFITATANYFTCILSCPKHYLITWYISNKTQITKPIEKNFYTKKCNTYRMAYKLYKRSYLKFMLHINQWTKITTQLHTLCKLELHSLIKTSKKKNNHSLYFSWCSIHTNEYFYHVKTPSLSSHNFWIEILLKCYFNQIVYSNLVKNSLTIS